MRARHQGGQGERRGGAGVEGAVVEVPGQARARPDQEGDGLCGGGGGGERGQAFLGVVGEVEEGAGLRRGGGGGGTLGPGDGKGVGGPEADGGQREEDVLARLNVPGAGDAEGQAHGFAREELDGGFGGVGAEVAVEEGGESEQSVDGPDGDDHFHERLGGEVGQVDPEAGEDEGHECDVEMEEGFIKGVAKGGEGGHEDA